MARKDSLESGTLTDAAFYILLSLQTEQHGYLIMQQVEDWTGGEMKIGPASLYTTLKKLTDAEVIETAGGSGKRKAYRITAKGQTMLEEEIERRRRMVQLAEDVLTKREERAE
ncbi:PadR family transcriptional regulator [Alkalicoccus luteus]|uniref:PadR family transcriptional regulator n=1 Tax=Alkalicoccus luteus TaxID=1237094 RepID=A0A969PW96_9BACI|nr:PadR family transcriptional regulator [Alkalicoccus luteus]NJP38659.1 PadR family transcriptional regulator [Alkalicoccus luteus]